MDEDDGQGPRLLWVIEKLQWHNSELLEEKQIINDEIDLHLKRTNYALKI